jgi:hypothetical protein
MAERATYTPVRVGQVWADNDPRTGGGRLLKVYELDSRTTWTRDNSALSVPIAICRRVVGPNRESVGRRLEIRIDRFRPTSTGYRLVEDVNHG